MENYFIIFFVIFIFMKNIFVDLRILLFTVMSICITYFISKWKNEEKDNSYIEKSEKKDISVYNYGNPIRKENFFKKENYKVLDDIKDILNNLNVNNRSKIELISNIKKFEEIFVNDSNYNYFKNYIDDLLYRKNIIFNMVSSLNFVNMENDDNVSDLFNIIEEHIDKRLEYIKKNVSYRYDYIDMPKGFDNNNLKKYELF